MPSGINQKRIAAQAYAILFCFALAISNPFVHFSSVGGKDLYLPFGS